MPLGSGPAANAILMVFYLLFRDTPIFIFPWSDSDSDEVRRDLHGRRGRRLWFCRIFLVLHRATVRIGGGVWLVPVLWRRKSLLGAVEDRIYGVRNGYYRWKRRRAGKKFEVYMRKYDRY